MAATHSTKWFWSDWLGDQEVRRLSPAERGLWIDLLGLAAVGSPVGYVCDDRGRSLPLEEIRRVTNAASIEEVTKLIEGILEKGAASRDRAGRLYNRRMVREAALTAKRKRNGAIGGERTALLWKGIKDLPGYAPSRPPRQNEASLIPIKKITTTELGAPKESSASVNEMLERMALARKRA